MSMLRLVRKDRGHVDVGRWHSRGQAGGKVPAGSRVEDGV
jgi:hypothetical protein